MFCLRMSFIPTRRKAARTSLAQRVDDFPISCLWKRFQRARPDVSQHAHLQAETCCHSVVRSFEDRDHVIVAHGQVEGFELAAHIFEGSLRSIQTTWRFLRLQNPLLGPICKHDVGGHDRPPSGSSPDNLRGRLAPLRDGKMLPDPRQIGEQQIDQSRPFRPYRLQEISAIAQFATMASLLYPRERAPRPSSAWGRIWPHPPSDAPLATPACRHAFVTRDSSASALV